MEVKSSGEEIIGIETLHEYLKLHFRELSNQREEEIPIFALEHGLGSEERKQLKNAIQGIMPGRKKSWLPWIVHATEIGYGFSGQEYWKTFREETSGWWEYGNRQWLREKFKQFSDVYGGVEPQGAWAEHNSFIAWPVANAILAGDLRNHLIDILHEARDTLGSRDWQNTTSLGRQIRIRAQARSQVSRRFVQFAEQERLVGHIASALLFSEKEVGQVLIEGTALERILSSLEQEKLTQLQEASRSAQEGTAARRRANTVADAVRALRATLSIRPIGKREYRASLEIPGLDPLLEVNEDFEAALTNSDVKIKGAQQNRFPPRTLASGQTEVRLKKWTLRETNLVRFEDGPDRVAQVLNKHLFNTGSGPWLFKLRKDGKGKNIRSRSIRPGDSYVVAAREDELADLDFGVPVNIDASGIAGRHIDLNDPISGSKELALQELGFEVKGEVDVWPAGIVPAAHDGQEEATWLSTDTPILGIHSNLEVARYKIHLDEGKAISVAPEDEKEAVFVKIGGLSVGVHTLTVSADTNSGQQEEQMRVKVRRPEQSRGEKAKIWPLHMKISSPTAGFEELWENEIELSVQGPKDYEVDVSLNLHTQDSVEPLNSERDSMSLPITVTDWKQFVEERCLGSSEFLDRLDEAYEAKVTVDGDIIGSQEVSFERRHTLLRWRVVEKQGGRKVQLLDDTDVSHRTEVYRYAPDRPFEAIQYSGEGPEATYEAHPAGGLWHAKAKDDEAIRVMPPANAEMEWDREDLSRDAEEIAQRIRVLGLWGNGNAKGKSSTSLKRAVLSRAQEMIVRALCGVEWTKKEKQWLDSPERESRADLEAMIDVTTGKENPVREALASTSEPPGREELTTWIRDNGWLQQRRRIENIGEGKRVKDLNRLSRSGLARFAVRVMDDASHVNQWETLEKGIEQLIENPDLARSARAVVLSRRA